MQKPCGLKEPHIKGTILAQYIQNETGKRGRGQITRVPVDP